jgi:CarD family transcriptional regulator
MQFKIDDRVVHQTYGVGRVVEIEEKQFSEKGDVRPYYKIILSKRTVWIPVEAQEACGFRLITAKSELDQYRDLLQSPPTSLNINHHRRHLELVSRLKQGSFQAVCEVVRDLTAWSWRKPLGQTDTTTLQRTRANLYQEWAAAAGISTTEAIKEIDALLLPGRQVEKAQI